MVRLLFAFALTLCLKADVVSGRVTDGVRPLAGVRVYADRVPRPLASSQGPTAVTGVDGTFSLSLADDERVVVMEKDGHERDLVPVAALRHDVVLPPLMRMMRGHALVIRVSLKDQPKKPAWDDMHTLLFGRRPGEASAANYFYEISKGRLLLTCGAIRACTVALSRREALRPGRLAREVLKTLQGQDLRDHDQVDNRTGAPRPDGLPDHLWIVGPGPTSAVTSDPGHLPTESRLVPLPWQPQTRWPVVCFTEETPLGFIVHELMHAQGEHRVDDFYADGKPITAGGWDVMDAGMLRGWERPRSATGPWLQELSTCPAHPMGWTRADLWYRGAFADAVPAVTMGVGVWEGWIAPLARASGQAPQRLIVPDPRKRGCFWEFNVRRPWGFDGGRVGHRWGPGYEGLVVAHVDPGRLGTDGASKAPVRVQDAHPQTPEPPLPRFPGGRWQLEDAAYNCGPGEQTEGRDGPLRWHVLASDNLGRMQVHLEWNSAPQASP